MEFVVVGIAPATQVVLLGRVSSPVSSDELEDDVLLLLDDEDRLLAEDMLLIDDDALDTLLDSDELEAEELDVEALDLDELVIDELDDDNEGGKLPAVLDADLPPLQPPNNIATITSVKLYLVEICVKRPR